MILSKFFFSDLTSSFNYNPQLWNGEGKYCGRGVKYPPPLAHMFKCLVPTQLEMTFGKMGPLEDGILLKEETKAKMCIREHSLNICPLKTNSKDSSSNKY